MAVTNKDRVIKMTAATDAVTGTITIKKIRWVGTATAGDDLNITNTAGTEILVALAGVAHNSQEFDFGPEGFTCLGVIVATLGSGTVYIYV